MKNKALKKNHNAIYCTKSEVDIPLIVAKGCILDRQK